jgi:hypothetical protein
MKKSTRSLTRNRSLAKSPAPVASAKKAAPKAKEVAAKKESASQKKVIAKAAKKT